MSLGGYQRYVPHSETTKAYYEQLLLDLRRCLPPGVDDDMEDIAEQALAIICVGGTSSAGVTAETVQQQQAALERLLDTPLKRETRDHLLRYGRLITDYVAWQDEGDAGNGVMGGAKGGGVLNLDEEGPSSSGSASDEQEEDDDEAALIAGISGHRKGKLSGDGKKRRKALHEDKTLSRFAFDATDVGGGLDDEVAEENMFETDSMNGAEWGAVVGATGEFGAEDVAPRITFDEVACNPSYVKDTVRRLFPAQTVEKCEAQAARVVDFLAQDAIDDFALETQLTAFLSGYDNEEVMDWISDVRGSRWGIVYGLRYAACATQKEKTAVMDAMREHARRDANVERLYQSLTGKEVDVGGDHRRQPQPGGVDDDGDRGDGVGGGVRQSPLRRVDLQACAFQDERTPHRHVRATVPQGTQRAMYETHDEVILPPSPVYNKTEDPLVPITEFPAWCRDAFRGVTKLNPMQSRTYECAFKSDENMLVSAPTGAGKTNVAMMAMLRAIENATDRTTGAVNRRELKMVYVAPMKALVQEVVRAFSARLEPLGLVVAELSGDSAMSQRQMAETQLIVTTPEKWDIVTRKSVELGVAALLKLLIIDEVHLLHNERGPVLEAIVARTMMQQQLRGAAGIRVVGLSATLPNVEDVASFLQVDRQRGLFVFDSTYRPIPLEQTFCAVKRVKGLNQAAVMNRVAYDKVLQAAQDNEQVMIFVHSRKETEYTAMYLQRRATEERHSHYFVRPGSDHEKVLQDTVNSPDSGLRRALQQLLPGGFAIHHAGLSREERQTVEELFADRRIKVLVCTSTLAWGVNLPANRVIIKGTRVFNGAKGESELLSALDVLQMFGRAGRVGFGANVGRAAIITSADDLHYYLCVLNELLPIESQMMKRVVDMLNAEISLGHVESTKEGVRWLQRTYLYVRMRKVPQVYGVRPSASDPLLLNHLENIVHTACEELKLARMAEYDVASRKTGTTPYGRIASHCYVTTASMSMYLANLSNAMQDVDIFRVFAMSSEFTNLTVRVEEQAQLKELLENAPIAVRESRYTPLAKINILLQCYISRKNLEGLPLMSEMVYIKDSAQRILRALYEICLVREFGRTARQFLQLYAMVVHRQWAVESPIRQVREVLAPKSYEAILPILERVRVPWEELRLWSTEDLADRLGDDRRAAMAHECIRHVPHFTVEAAVRPLARNMLYVDVDITPDFLYNAPTHGNTACEVLLLVESPNCRIIHSESVYIPAKYLEQQQTYVCPPTVVPMIEPKPTHLFVRCVSPNWLGCEATAAVCLLNMPLPPIAAPLREMDDSSRGGGGQAEKEVGAVLEPYRLGPVAEKIFSFESFLACQRELVDPIFEGAGDNIFAGIPPGGGKTAVAELFVLQFLLDCALEESEEKATDGSVPTDAGATKGKKKVLYITSNEDTAERRFMDWQFKFGEVLKLGVAKLDRTRSPTAQVAEVRAASLVVTSGAALVSWVRANSPVLRDVTHIIADHLHLLRAPEGRAVEECLARLQSSPFLAGGGVRRARLLALSYPLISCAELGRWLKIHPSRQYNFGLSYRQLRVRVEGVEVPGARSRYETSVVSAIKSLQRNPYAAAPSVLFVPYAREAEEVAKRLLLRCRDFIPQAGRRKTTKTKNSSEAGGRDEEDGEEGSAQAKHSAGEVPETDDARLGVLLSAGVGYLHRGTSMLDVLTIFDQIERPAVHPDTGADLPLLLVCSFDAAWRLPAALFGSAFVCSAERLVSVPEDLAGAGSGSDGGGGNTTAPQDCSASELLQMVSRASNEAVVFCRTARRWVWSHLLNDPLPLESHLRYPEDFCDVVNAAVAQGRARNVMEVLRVLQSHYFLHHVRTNLPFYDLAEAEDIPLFASDFASRVVRALAEERCVDVGTSPAAVGNAEEEEGRGGDDDPHAPIRPTPRGAAIAHHCVTLDSVRAVNEAVAAAAATSDALTATQLWQLLATHCEELLPAQLGDAARITEGAEYRALHTIARSLPSEKFALRYIDLDFAKSSTKVFLLVLAHCARIFPDLHLVASAGIEAEDDQHGDPYALFSCELDDDTHDTPSQRHLFRYAEVPAADRELLCAIPHTLATRLLEDLLHLLPVVAHVVASMAELLDLSSSSASVDNAAVGSARHSSSLVGLLMSLSQCVQRRVWVGEDALLQLPTAQVARLTHAVIRAAGISLPQLQQEGAKALPTSTAEKLLLDTTGDGSRGEARRAAQLRYITTHLLAEALGVPRVTSLAANGGIDNGVAVEGVLALAVTVSATIAWEKPRHTDEGVASAEVERRWWVVCDARKKGSSATGRILGMRVAAIEEAASPATDGAYALSSRLLFPLAKLEAEGDLDSIDLVVTLTSEAYRASSEAAVAFDLGAE